MWILIFTFVAAALALLNYFWRRKRAAEICSLGSKASGGGSSSLVSNPEGPRVGLAWGVPASGAQANSCDLNFILQAGRATLRRDLWSDQPDGVDKINRIIRPKDLSLFQTEMES